MKVHELRHESDCGVNNLTFCDMASERDCTCGAVVREYEAEIERLRAALRDASLQIDCNHFGRTYALANIDDVLNQH